MKYLLILLTLMVSACASDDKEKEFSAKEHYDMAIGQLEKEEYLKAAENFAAIEREHPYSPLATEAPLMEGYAYYAKSHYDEALVALASFIQMHPGHKEIPYAYYLRALCFYEQISDAHRDQQMTLLALGALEEVVTRFPNTVYAKDARIKLDLARDHLAGKEMEIGRYYQSKGEVNAAIGRFMVVVEEYQTTPQIQEALFRLVESYLALGVVDEANKYGAILGHNYPNSDWYKQSYNLLKSYAGNN